MLANLATEAGVAASLVSTELVDPDGLLFNLDAVFDKGTINLSGVCDRSIGTLSSSLGDKLDLRCRPSDGPSDFSISFQRAIEAFAADYLAGKRPPTTGEDGLQAMRLEQALVESARSGTFVNL